VRTIILSLLPARRDRRDESEATTAMREIQEAVRIIFLRVCARQATADFRLLVGCYLHQSGLSRRGNDVLEGFGLSLAFLRRVANMEIFVL
jgi:hypothetical protein